MVLLGGMICRVDLLFDCLVWLTDLSLVLGVFWIVWLVYIDFVGYGLFCCGYLLGFAFAFS